MQLYSRQGYLLVFEVDFLGSDAAPAGFKLSGPQLQHAELFIPEGCGWGWWLFFTLHSVWALKGIIVHYLILVFWNMASE